MSHPFLEEVSDYFVPVQYMAFCCKLLAVVICDKDSSFDLLLGFFLGQV